jgi:eukaryotic-like serine/threonine-protein kinase
MAADERRGYRTEIMADVETAYRRLLRFQLKVMGAFLLVLVVVGGSVAAVLIVVLSDGGSKTVPDVVGLDNVGTAVTLEHAGLSPGYIRLDQASNTVQFGHVIRTDPPAGTRVKRGGIVRVTFSCGRAVRGFCNP